MPTFLRCLIIICCLCIFSELIQAQSTAQKLSLPQTLTEQLSNQQTKEYELSLSSGQFLAVHIECRNCIPYIRLLTSTGEQLMRRDFMRMPVKGKLIYRVAQNGIFRLTITREPDTREEAVQVILTAQVLAQPNEQELAHARGLLLQSKIWPLYSQGTKQSLTQLLAVTEEAVQLSRQLHEREWEANALTYTAEAYKTLEQYERALEYFQQALPIIREIGVQSRVAGALTPIGQIYFALSNYPKALEYYLAALPYLDEKLYPNILGWNLTNIGHVYQAYGELPKAIEYYQRSYQAYGQYQGEQNEKPLGQGVAMSGLANAYFAMGQKQQAILHQRQALESFKAAKNLMNEHLAYARLGEMYTALGEYSQAEIYLTKAIQHFKETQTNAEASVRRNLGMLARMKEDYAAALMHLQTALTIHRKTKERRGAAQCLTEIGTVYVQHSQWRNALQYFDEAQQIWQEIGDKLHEARTLNRLGQVYIELQETNQAHTLLQQSLALSRLTLDRESEAETLYQLARIDAQAAHFEDASKKLERVLAITESVRATIDNQELRTTYLTTVRTYYEFYVEVLMQLHRLSPTVGHNHAALQATEMARARTLSETLADTHRQVRQGVAPQQLQHVTELQQRLNAKAEYQRRLVSNRAKPELLQSAAQEIQILTAELQEARTAIQTMNSPYAALDQAQPLSVQAMQKSLLDENTLLLVYALGSPRSYLWLVSRNELRSYELPARERIEAAARRVYELLLPPLSDAATLEQALSDLQQLILAPIGEQLGEKRLLIVADGALQYIPFAALPEAKNLPLIVKHEIVNLPSINALAILRRELGERVPAPKTIAVFADPVFSNDDVRVINGKLKKQAAPLSADLEKALRDIGENESSLRRLPFTRREADTITRLVNNQKRGISLDFSASRANALSASLRDYRVVHFATHGILNSTHPDLSGLVLSLVDERGRAQDGFFRLHEIYNLQLNADLVVLSACQTGLGKEVKGEGLIGLTRGFMYAGVPRVIASLWKVNDRATAELMQKFYQAYLGEKHFNAAAALRAAQLELRQQNRWSHPGYWAAFTLQGEWN